MERNPHVLVVDDEPELLHILVGYLDRIGFQVTAASDIEAALHAANVNPIDIVLTDLCLGLDCGMTLIERLWTCLLYTSPSPRDGLLSRMPSSA